RCADLTSIGIVSSQEQIRISCGRSAIWLGPQVGGGAAASIFVPSEALAGTHVRQWNLSNFRLGWHVHAVAAWLRTYRQLLGLRGPVGATLVVALLPADAVRKWATTRVAPTAGNVGGPSIPPRLAKAIDWPARHELHDMIMARIQHLSIR